MATEILIPKLGMTMTEGTVDEWYIRDGGEVKSGENIYRLETEKIEFEVEAEADGIVRHTAEEGTTLEPGAVVGYILAAGEEMPAGVAPVASAETSTAAVSPADGAAPATVAPGGRVSAAPIARRLAKEAGLDLATIAGTGPNGRITEVDVAAAKAAAVQPTSPMPSTDIVASPVARRLAKERGIDLATVRGTGPGGRITKEDVDGAVSAPVADPATPAGEVIPMRGMRRVIAQRMHASLSEMAQLTLGADVTMDEAIKLRTQLVDEWEPEGIRPTYTDLIIRAVAKALLSHPRVNATITEAGIETLADVHVGMAVALDDGLVVPVIRDAGTLSLRDIAVETTRLASAARDGKLGPDEMAGSTFSVTSLGPGVVDFFTPIINPPNVAILGVGRIRDGMRWDGDQPRKCQEMTLSLTIDHRALDGTPAAAFLAAVRDLLESPYRLLV